MRWRIVIASAIATILAWSIGIGLVGCGDSSSEGDSWVAASDGSAPDASATANDSGSTSRRDGGGAADGTVDSNDTGSEEDAGSDTSFPFGEDTDRRVDSDAGSTGALSCNEFYKCTNFLCDRYDYQCRGNYQSRMPTSEQTQRRTFEQCSQNNCANKTGRARTRCNYEQCGMEWTACYTHPNGDAKLNCGEYTACRNACYYASDPTQCRQDCRNRAKSGAVQKLQVYGDCYSKHCQGERGSAAAECVRKHCLSEFRGCYGC